MHHSDDETRQTAVTCYLDESGTDENSPNAVLGGLVLNRADFLSFDEKWSAMLARHRITPPLHMKEFGRGGRLASIGKKDRVLLFKEVAAVVNSHKVLSLAGTISQSDFRNHFSKEVRKRFMGPYGMSFIICAILSWGNAQRNNYTKKIAYLVDEGNAYKTHVLNAHAALQEIQHSRFLNLGSITFETDDNCSPLQAADVIAWTVRRALEQRLKTTLLPLRDIVNLHHSQLPLDRDGMLTIGTALNSFLAESGNTEVLSYVPRSYQSLSTLNQSYCADQAAVGIP